MGKWGWEGRAGHNEAEGGALMQPDQPDGCGDHNPVEDADMLNRVQHRQIRVPVIGIWGRGWFP